MLTCVFLFVAFITVLALIHYDVHMFQQNSYRAKRYFRWWRSNGLSDGRLLLLVGVASALHSAVAVVAVLSFCVYSYKEKIRKCKTPLVFTARVKRLCFTTLILFAGLGVGAYLSVGVGAYFFSIMGSALLFSNVLMLVANVINMPLERFINYGYYRDARSVLRSHKRLIVIGVTGSYGKTSVKNYLYRMLSEHYNVLITPGNYNTLLGVVRTVRESLRPYHDIFIVEMGAKQRGDIREICDLVHPTIGVISSVGEAHLETFGSVANIQKTKFELVNALPDSGLALINYDSENIRSFKGVKSACTLMSYGIQSAEAQLRAEYVEYSNQGLAFSLVMRNGTKQHFTSPLLGGGNVLNLIAGVAVSDYLGVSAKKIRVAIADLQPVEHRLSVMKGAITILDDAYNSNPEGARMALEVLRDFARGEGAKRIVITPGFVEMGERQYEANKGLGRDISACVDYAIVVNKLNREAIVEGLAEGGFDNAKMFIASDLTEARAHLATIIKVGDIVLYENDLPDSFK